MITDRQKSLLDLLQIMQEKNLPLSKIAIQKTAYFLSTQGVPMRYSFKPFSYGPYAKDIAEDLHSLEFWDYIELNDSTYAYAIPASSPVSERHNEVAMAEDEAKAKKMAEGVETFSAMLGDISSQNAFNLFELYGTTLYCCEALLLAGEELSPENVYIQVCSWKGKKYSQEKVARALSKLRDYV